MAIEKALQKLQPLPSGFLIIGTKTKQKKEKSNHAFKMRFPSKSLKSLKDFKGNTKK